MIINKLAVNKENIKAYGILLFIFICITQNHTAFAEDKIINPHWTGLHCAECHLDGKPPALRYNGDPIKVCSSCHEKEIARTDVHPVGIVLKDDMNDRMPSSWPLRDGKVTCLTCHEPLIQMYYDPEKQEPNPEFLREAPYTRVSDFCFKCHQQQSFKKTNPHEQLNQDGESIETKCLYCHQVLPDPSQAENIQDVTFVDERTDICFGCHPNKSSMHPAQSNHLVDIPSDIKPEGLYLPVIKGKIFCGTCHNPHQKGVIKKEEAAAGAGVKYFLRSENTYKLCTTCHSDKNISSEKGVYQSPDMLRKIPGAGTSHKPWEEKKCKICHAASRENRSRPEPAALCFRDGCHKSEIINSKFVHEKSVTKNCYFCHESHTAGYDKLLRVNESKLCYVCHQLLPDRKERLEILKYNKDLHPSFNKYIQNTDLPDDKACSFCHNPQHKTYIKTTFPGICSDCHIFLSNKFSDNSKSKSVIHNTNKNKKCSDCHNPHSSEHHYQLIKPLETYKETR